MMNGVEWFSTGRESLIGSLVLGVVITGVYRVVAIGFGVARVVGTIFFVAEVTGGKYSFLRVVLVWARAVDVVAGLRVDAGFGAGRVGVSRSGNLKTPVGLSYL